MKATVRAIGRRRTLRDSLGRDLHYLRLSVTDRCNFRCVYCLPDGCPKASAEHPLSREEIGRLVHGFAGMGFWKVRLTGGEPTLRPDIARLVEEVARTPGIRRVGLSTNGYRLAEMVSELREAGLASLNVSLDSLDPGRFREITGSARLGHVVAGIEEALAVGIPSVKVNVVLLGGLDDRELGRLLDWTRDQPLTVRFIELMETAGNVALFRRSRLPAARVVEKLERLGWARLPRDDGDGPATNYGHPDHAGKAGVISAYSGGFCDTCNRLRVTSTGDLRLCLFGDQHVSLRPLLRHDGSQEELMDLVERSVQRKPAAHELSQGRCGSTASLAMTGG
jgi:cyclic pyranopterin phosphate synthase